MKIFLSFFIIFISFQVMASEKKEVRSEAAQAWEAVKESQDPDELKVFIKHFKHSFYGEIVQIRLEKILKTPKGENLGGTYNVIGTDPLGVKYSGTAVVTPNGSSILIDWIFCDGITYRGAVF